MGTGITNMKYYIEYHTADGFSFMNEVPEDPEQMEIKKPVTDYFTQHLAETLPRTPVYRYRRYVYWDEVLLEDGDVVFRYKEKLDAPTIKVNPTLTLRHVKHALESIQIMLEGK